MSSDHVQIHVLVVTDGSQRGGCVRSVVSLAREIKHHFALGG